jgi:hypothetical protein
MDRTTAILVEALRLGAGQDAETRLYRAGKFPGLFPSRTTHHAEAAARALREGLIEMVRTEAKGKTSTEWVRVTSKGTRFVLEHESPARALEDMMSLLRANLDGCPHWLAELRGQVQTLGQNLAHDVEAMRRRIESVAARVEDALKRLDAMRPAPPEGAAGALPWAHRAVEYLDQRKKSSLGERCPLPELFSHVRERESDLTLHDFHSGLRRLHDRGLVRLLPCPAAEPPHEPEYLLLDGPNMYYFAAAA